LDEFVEVMFKVGEWPWELNLPSARLKNDYGEVDEEIFQGVERQCEVIFCIMGIEKINLDGYLSDVLSGRMALRTHYLPSVFLKMRLCSCRTAMFHDDERKCIFYILGIQKSELDEVAEVMF
jgi:hypothetical protein